MFQQTRFELRKFAETTSLKGIKRTIVAQSSILRIFWVIALLFCCGMLLFQVVTVVLNYCSFSALRNSAVLHTEPSFPHITVCNLFPAFESESYSFEKYLQKVEFIKGQAPSYFQKNDELWRFLRQLLTYYINIDILSELEGSSDVLKEFFVECNEYGWNLFSSKTCIPTVALNRPFQLCKTIKARSGTGAVRFSVFLDNFYNKPNISYFSSTRIPLSTGVKVLIHPPGKKPDPNNAIYAPPGTDLTINVDQKNITRLPHPYGKCAESQRTPEEDEYGSFPYNQEACISLCRQCQFIDACGCMDKYEYFTMTDLRNDKNNFCFNLSFQLGQSPEFISNGRLTDKFWNRLNCSWTFAPVEDHCNCPIQCFEMQYEQTSSGAPWPDVHYQLSFYEQFIRNDKRFKQKFLAYEEIFENLNNESDEEILRRLETLKLIERNFVQVTIRMNDRRVEKITYIPSMSWDTLASNVGGSLNLWLGISVLTAAEIVELLYSLFNVMLQRQQPTVQIHVVHKY